MQHILYYANIRNFSYKKQADKQPSPSFFYIFPFFSSFTYQFINLHILYPPKHTNTNMPHEVHIPYLSEDEKIFLNTAATYSQARRMSNTIDNNTTTTVRPSIEENTTHHRHSNNHPHRRQQVVSVSSLSFLWKRRGSSASSLTLSSSNGSMDYEYYNGSAEERNRSSELPSPKSPKGRELESLIFDQPQRTVRLSLTPRCAV